MSRQKSDSLPPVPLVRRASLTMPTRKYGELSGVVDLLDYGRGTRVSTGLANLMSADGVPFQGTVTFPDGGPIVVPHKKNGRPPEIARDIAVCLAVMYYESTTNKTPRACVVDDWSGFKGIKTEGEVSKAKGRALDHLLAGGHGLFLTLQLPGLDMAFIEGGGGFRIVPPGNGSPGRLEAHGTRWVWRRGDEKARLANELVSVFMEGHVDAYSWPSEEVPAVDWKVVTSPKATTDTLSKG